MAEPRPAKRRPPRARRWTLLREVLAVGVALLILTVVMSVLLLTTATHLGSAQRRQADLLDAAQNDTSVLLGEYLDQETGLRGYQLAGQPFFLQPYDEAARTIPRTEQRLRTELATVPRADHLLASLIGAYQAWHGDFAVPQLAEISGGHLAEAQEVAETGEGKTRFNAIRAQLTSLRTLLRNDQRTAEVHIQALQRRLEILLIVTLSVLGIAIVGTVVATLLRVVRPLHALAGAARRVAGGQLLAHVPISGPAESRDLGSDLTAMRQRLLEEIERARLAGEALLHDGPTVSALHTALTPRMDGHPDLLAVGRLDPAEGVLAGDWYDLLRIDDTLAVVVGDVSGHGPASAVLALGMRTVITTVLVSGGNPGEALAAAAASVAQGSPEHFATVFVAVVDPGAHQLRYANAGHPSGIVAHQSAASEELGPTGPLVSPIVARWSWSTQVHPFHPGDRLLVYTDGVTEGRNAIKEEYGIERLKADLAGSLPDEPADAVAVIAGNVNRFVGALPTDDRTLVYCQHQAPVQVG